MFAKACLVDRKKLQDAQARKDIIDAEQVLRDAFYTDVQPLLGEWRKRHGIDPNPMKAYRASGYEAKVAKARTEYRAAKGIAAGGSYA
jgi:L-rhamnose isomerase/sugar isomerase